MTHLNANTKKAAAIINEASYAGKGDIFAAYDKPSAEKVKTFLAIKERAVNTPGYNHDLRVSGAGSFNYSTIYTVSNADGTTSYIKDTKCNTFVVTC